MTYLHNRLAAGVLIILLVGLLYPAVPLSAQEEQQTYRLLVSTQEIKEGYGTYTVLNLVTVTGSNVTTEVIHRSTDDRSYSFARMLDKSLLVVMKRHELKEVLRGSTLQVFRIGMAEPLAEVDEAGYIVEITDQAVIYCPRYPAPRKVREMPPGKERSKLTIAS